MCVRKVLLKPSEQNVQYGHYAPVVKLANWMVTKRKNMLVGNRVYISDWNGICIPGTSVVWVLIRVQFFKESYMFAFVVNINLVKETM